MATIVDTKAALAELADLIDTFVEPENYTRWLKQQSKFHKYSFRNSILIMLQKPDASYVAGFQAWIKQHGRCVRKGETGIKILAPVPFQKEKDGKLEKGIFFKVISVFDVSQTDPLLDAKHVFEPETAPVLLDDVRGADLYEYAEAWMVSDGVKVQSENDGGHTRANGWYRPSGPEIFVRPAPNLAKAETLIHEIAHHLQTNLPEKEDYGYAGNEVVVESAAYVVCHHFGLDVALSAVPYVRSWLQQDRKAFEKGLGTISRLAESIIVELDRRLGGASALPVEG